MADPARFRDSTQIVLPPGVLEGHRDTLETEYTVTIVDGDGVARIVGSPVQIRAVSEYLLQRGVPLP